MNDDTAVVVMSDDTVKIKRISSSKRKDPLNDINTLNKIGRAATKQARNRAFENGASVTIAIKGSTYRLKPDGSKELVRQKKTADFPRIEDDLCLG